MNTIPAYIAKFKKHLPVILLIIVSACETERIIFTGPYFVRFTETSVSYKESYSPTIQIQVHLAGPAAEGDIAVHYSVSGSARENVDYRFVGTKGQTTIKSGKYFGTIDIQLINNSNNILRTQDLIFTLTSVNGNDLSVGQGEGGIGKKFTLTIVDDCILGGKYSGSRGSFSVPTKGIEISSGDCETYNLSNWNISIINYPLPLELTFIDNGDNTLTIPNQEINFTLEGIGSVNPLTKEINITIKLLDFDAPNEFSIKYTPE